MARTKEQYIDDAPITSGAEDRFSRWPFSERIAQVIARRTDPSSIVIGIYGPWGDGKTSVLNMMAQAFDGDDNVVCIKFNPWHFEDEQHLIRAFFDTLADALDKKLTTKTEKIGEVLNRYGGILSLASLTLGHVATINPGAAAKSLGEQLSNVKLEELKSRVSDALIESGKRVVVLIDDIDRLDRSEIHAILKLVKLSASFSNTAYVLAFDDEVVAASLAERYGSGDAAAGRQFLEKIIQVPLHLPDAEPSDLQAICFEGLNEVIGENSIDLNEDDAEAFVRHFTEGIMPAIHTPRQVKRYLNAVRFAVPLLKGEVHVVDQLLIEALRTAYSRLYLSVRDNPSVYTGEQIRHSIGDGAKQKEAVKEVVEAGLKELGRAERAGALYLLKTLFPTLDGVYGNTTYDDSYQKIWDSEKRITSDDYFRRYFQYSVPARDVADARIGQLVESAAANDAAAIDAFFDHVAERKAWTRCLDKLFARVGDVSSGAAKALALGLARKSQAIPTEKGMFSSIMSSSSRASTLAARLVARVDDPPERLTAALETVRAATSLSFAMECLRTLKSKRKGADAATLDDSQEKQVGAVIAGKFADAFTAAPDYASYGREIGSFLWIWKTYGPSGDMAAFLTKRFNEHSEEAVQFLDRFIGRAYGMESGLSHRDSFDRSEYDSVAQLIDPDVIVAALKTTFGGLLTDVTFDKCYELQGDQQTACRFVAIYNKVKSEKTAKPADN